MTKLFFATDIHGSDICWNKFLNAGKFYEADVLILGGDITGKAVVPFIHQGGERYIGALLEQEFLLTTAEELADMKKRVRSRGYYPYLTNPDEIAELEKDPRRVTEIFNAEVLKIVQQWMEIAEKKLSGTDMKVYCSPGNDDMDAVDDIIRASKRVILVEGLVTQLDEHHEMIASGWSNRTPWNTHREEDEERLKIRYETMISQLKNRENAIFNVHVPPYKSGLDEAPELDKNLRPVLAGQALKPVGSTALRETIERYQPLLGLHGHIHEGRGATRIGKTLCLNPGSMYEQGVLLGAIVKLGKNKIENYVLTSG
ncbi:MAG: metallophosphoesterase [Anaerolineaceae bacterium]|nr:metallophosphoesterase [Anaerolineaceae bacterium]